MRQWLPEYVHGLLIINDIDRGEHGIRQLVSYGVAVSGSINIGPEMTNARFSAVAYPCIPLCKDRPARKRIGQRGSGLRIVRLGLSELRRGCPIFRPIPLRMFCWADLIPIAQRDRSIFELAQRISRKDVCKIGLTSTNLTWKRIVGLLAAYLGSFDRLIVRLYHICSRRSGRTPSKR